MDLYTRRAIGAVVAVAALAATTAANAQSDTCAKATPIAIGETVTGNTFFATNDGVASCGSAQTAPDDWFSFTAKTTQSITVASCGSQLDTVLSIHTGCPGNTLNEVACDDASCDPGSRVSFTAEFGQTYYIRVAGNNDTFGAYTLTLTAGSGHPGDDCNAPIVVTDDEIVTGTTFGATSDGSATCGSSFGSPDVWFSYTAPATRRVSFRSCGSLYDTAMSIHTGCPGDAKTEIACMDDGCVLASRIDLNVVEGVTYLVRLGGYKGGVGDYTFRVQTASVAGDDCAQAISISAGQTLSGSTDGTSNDGIANCGESNTSADTWYRFVAPTTCAMVVSLCGSSYDTVLSIHSACAGTTANQLACNDNAPSCGLASRINLNATVGETYLFRIAGFRGETGSFQISVTCEDPTPQPNDACTNAITIVPGVYSATTSGSTPDGISSCGDSNTAPDVWYALTADRDCILLATTCGAAYDTVLSLHSACPGTAANELACNDNSCGAGSRVATRMDPGQTVYIRVAGSNGAAGAYDLTVTCEDPPPPTEGADAYLGELGGMGQFGRVDGVIGCAIDSPVCNAGSMPLDWYANPDPRHPFMVFNMYRLDQFPDSPSRLVQIGQSWAKHGVGATQENACGFGCIPTPDNTRLGVGCSDTYSAAFNAVQDNLGPRREINPWTGSFNYAGSHFDTPQPKHTPISHLLQIREFDMDSKFHPFSSFVAEVYVVAHDDENHMNSIAHEPVDVSGSSGSTWTFDISGVGTSVAPAITSWPGATFTTIPSNPTTDGRCILAVNVTPVLGVPGRWRYEYALYNHDMDRAVRSFSIPVGGATITDVGFYAVESHDEEFFDNEPWMVNIENGAVTWSTDTIDLPTLSNPVRWGTMYNFWFEADRAPVESQATLLPYKTGGPAAFVGATHAPANSCPADWNRDTVVNSQDFFDFLISFFANNADFNADGVTNSQDFFDFLQEFFTPCV